MDASLPEPDSGASTPCQSPIIATLDLAERLKDCRLEPGDKIVAYYSPANLAAEHAILSAPDLDACVEQQPIVTLTQTAERMLYGRWDELSPRKTQSCERAADRVAYLVDGGFTDDAGVVMPSQAQEEQVEDVVYEEELPDVGRKARVQKRVEAVADDEVVAVEEEADAPATAAPRPKVAAQHATVGVAAPEVDVKKLVEDSAGASGYTVMLALIAVVGGGAGWKFYQNYAKQKHDQAMKALEIEQARVDKQQNDHQACAAKNAALVTQIESADSKINTQAAQIGDLHAKLSALESKVTAIPDSQPDLGFTAKDFEKVDKRLKLVEKKLQPPKPTA